SRCETDEDRDFDPLPAPHCLDPPRAAYLDMADDPAGKPRTQIHPPASTAGSLAAVELTGVNKWYGAFHVLKDVNLTVGQRERIVICGPSGSGKSTLIRCVNRLETHQSGRIVVDGIELTEDLRQIDKVRAEVGMVFQSFNLFPHLTVLANLCLGPVWVKRMPRTEAEKVALKYLERVRIPDQAMKYPGQLS